MQDDPSCFLTQLHHISEESRPRAAHLYVVKLPRNTPDDLENDFLHVFLTARDEDPSLSSRMHECRENTSAFQHGEHLVLELLTGHSVAQSLQMIKDGLDGRTVLDPAMAVTEQELECPDSRR